MGKKKILIVDDEFSIRVMMFKILKSDNYQIDIAENGRQAIDCIDKTSYDLIITDYSMPGINGLELMRTIRERYPDVPFLFVTGTESVRNMLKEKGVGFSLKPFKISDLKKKVENMLSGIAGQDQSIKASFSRGIKDT